MFHQNIRCKLICHHDFQLPREFQNASHTLKTDSKILLVSTNFISNQKKQTHQMLK